jgi:hypothetical protein
MKKKKKKKKDDRRGSCYEEVNFVVAQDYAQR